MKYPSTFVSKPAGLQGLLVGHLEIELNVVMIPGSGRGRHDREEHHHIRILGRLSSYRHPHDALANAHSPSKSHAEGAAQNAVTET